MLGLGRAVEDIICAAEITRENDNIEYLIVGDGVMKEALIKQANSLNLKNIVFTGGVSFNESLSFLKTADAAVVALIKNEIFLSTIPSKFFDCMALGLPIILGVDGEARKILEDNNTGIYYEPGNCRDLVDKIEYLKNNRDKALQMGQNGKRLVYEKFRRSTLAREFADLINTSVSASRR